MDLLRVTINSSRPTTTGNEAVNICWRFRLRYLNAFYFHSGPQLFPMIFKTSSLFDNYLSTANLQIHRAHGPSSLNCCGMEDQSLTYCTVPREDGWMEHIDYK